MEMSSIEVTVAGMLPGHGDVGGATHHTSTRSDRSRTERSISSTTYSPTPALEGSCPPDPSVLRERWVAVRPGWTEAGWWDAPLDPQIRRLLWLPKGPELVAAVQRVPVPDGGRCPQPHPDLRDGFFSDIVGTAGNPCACQVVAIAAWATAAAWMSDRADQVVLHGLGAATQHPLLDPDQPSLGTITDPGVERVAPALRRSPDSLRNLLDRLRQRNSGSAHLTAAVAEGFLAAWQADLLRSDVADLDPDVEDVIIDTVVQSLRDRHRDGLVAWTFSDIRRHARRVRVRLGHEKDPRPRNTLEDRTICFQDFGGGTGRLIADLPVAVAAQIYRHLSATARGLADPDETRSMDQLRADVFTDLILGPEGDPAGNAALGSRQQVAVVISLATLTGADDRPGEMPGCGPIGAEMARALAADGQWRAWLTDAAGTVVATSARTYTPSAAVARVVRAREPHCRMPGCRRRVTDLDHVVPYPHGDTTVDNLSSLCRRHHNLKTHGRWQLFNHPDDLGTYSWTDPAGITHTDRVPPPLPVHHP